MYPPHRPGSATDFIPVALGLVLLALCVLAHGVLQSAATTATAGRPCAAACPCAENDRPATLPAVP